MPSDPFDQGGLLLPDRGSVGIGRHRGIDHGVVGILGNGWLVGPGDRGGQRGAEGGQSDRSSEGADGAPAGDAQPDVRQAGR